MSKCVCGGGRRRLTEESMVNKERRLQDCSATNKKTAVLAVHGAPRFVNLMVHHLHYHPRHHRLHLAHRRV